MFEQTHCQALDSTASFPGDEVNIDLKNVKERDLWTQAQIGRIHRRNLCRAEGRVKDFDFVNAAVEGVVN